MRRILLPAVLALSWVLSPPGVFARSANDCIHACDIESRTCGAAARADHKSCYGDCSARDVDAAVETCRVECRRSYGSARADCISSRTTCTEKCRSTRVETQCEEACLADRADCVGSLRAAGETGRCRKTCDADSAKGKKTCGGDRACVTAAESARAACLRVCASDAKLAQETCHGRFEQCVGGCTPATSAPPASADGSAASLAVPGPSTD